MDQRSFDLFLEVHRGLPRQAPGSRSSTQRALELAGALPACPKVLDLGCGPGAQSLDLARETGGVVTCVDNLGPFLGELAVRAAGAGLAERIEPVLGDMAALPDSVAPGSYDLVWSEGAIYNMGFDAGLSAWKRYLAPGGVLAVSDLCWLVDEESIPEPARAFWTENYPAMRTALANRDAMEAAGFEVLGDFTLPPEDWWANYYTPLLENLAGFEAKYAGDEAARAVAAAERAEIELFREHGEAYGYVFYVGRLPR
ncbi:class I SAM-dependent methyltransferase [Oceanidesulfovibrio indonesiensis]|uniref:Class I SAM-dependent methyltransferase n=1 Tax=Oceanidesulfovibrio indonesiensis TaxID=54767 RepID=A0A7M3MB28_9BACT|nr:class I SAM-dependent methyltransferase [Oceanidesulfovibrio indonesiensis]TVM15191.1 class I SAM-dependent methyltransferase [Oceanidesulfovibrio indonesiensis]